MTINWQFPLSLLETAVSGLASINITNPGSGYTSVPTVTIDPPPLGGIQANAFASMGVGSISVTAGGGGYIWPFLPIATISGGGGVSATATVQLTPYTVGSVVMDAYVTLGHSYTSPPTVQFSGGGGTGAAGTAMLSGGQVTAIVVENGGSGYTSVPTITMAGGGGFGATAVAILESTGTVGSLGISNAGSGYTSAPSIAVSGGGGSGVQLASILDGSVTGITTNTVQITGGASPYSAGYTGGSTPTVTIGPPDFTVPGASQATATAVVPGGFGSNTIVVTIGNPGAGYTSPPGITISGPDVPGPGANQAIGTATIAGGIAGVNIIYGGSGYSAGTYSLVFSGGGGTGAAGTATVSTSSIKAIVLTNPGNGYANPPTVSIPPPSSGNQASAAASVTAIGVSGVTITAPGKGYTSPPSVIFIGGGGSGAAAHTVLAPTTVASVTVTYPGAGYTSPPTCTISGGGGLGATAQTSLKVAIITPVGGYQYGTSGAGVPNITIASTDGNGSGATATAVLQSSLLSNDPFSVAQANVLITELAAVGAVYQAGIPIPVTARSVTYKVPTTVSWAELDKATRYAASVSSWFPAWPASWSMTPSADPVTVMTQRAIPLATALAAYSGTVDPFFAEIFSPLYTLAVPAFAFYVTSQREATTATTTPYDDGSPVGLQLSALIAQAEELTTYLETP